MGGHGLSSRKDEDVVFADPGAQRAYEAGLRKWSKVLDRLVEL